MKRQESMMESIGSHTDPQNIEKMKETKNEIESKVAKIMKLVRNDKKSKIPEDSRKRSSEIISLVEDIHKQYQSLYAQYEQLRGEKGKRARSRKEKEGSSSSTSSSDVEYYEAAEDIDSGRSIEHQEAAAKKLETGPSLKKKQEDRSMELQALVKVHEGHGNQASAQIKELEGQLTEVKAELELTRNLKKDLQEQIENKDTEVKQIGEKNKELYARISELEQISIKKGDELAATMTKMKDNESNSQSRIKELMGQVNNQQMEADSIRAEKNKLEGNKRNEASAQVKGLKDRVHVMQKELDFLRRQRTDLELQLDMKTKEVAENRTQIETLKDEIARKNISEEGLLKEKDGLLEQRTDLELEVHSLRNHRNKLEEVIRSKSREMDEVREEKERLNAKVFELEGLLIDKGDELFNFQKKYESIENETSAQIMAMNAQVTSLQQELNSLCSEKCRLEMQNERLKLDSEQSQIQAENEILGLTSKIEDQQRIVKEQEETIKKFQNEEKKQALIKHNSLDYPKHRSSSDSNRLNPQLMERKMEELAERFLMKTENHIRLLYQRILVAEKIHFETKDSYKKVKEMLEQENKDLNEKKTTSETELRKMRDTLLEPGMNVLTGMDMVVRKINQDIGDFLNRVSKISNELQCAKKWITGKNNEIMKLNEKLNTMTAQLEEKEKKEHSLRVKVWKLEAKLTKMSKPSGPSYLERRVGHLEHLLKQREEILLGFAEEKREAIRQLCVLTDYHRNRYDRLKLAVSKMNGRSKQRTT